VLPQIGQGQRRGTSLDHDGAHEFAAQHAFDWSSALDDALLDPRIKLIVIATPHSLHLQQVLAAAAASKAVFCEKPLALTKVDAMWAVEACRQAGVPLGLGANKRFWPSMRELTRIVRSGELARSSNTYSLRHSSALARTHRTK
jgi:predicted dehydrogenase